MKERPILFSSEMIRAILAGKKTQTRRLLRLPAGVYFDGWNKETFAAKGHRKAHPEEQTGSRSFANPYGIAGDRLWVRETWSYDARTLEECRIAHEDAMPGSGGPYYLATEVSPDTLKWIPSIHMPRWASRITLEVTRHRIERLHDITEADAIAEGARAWTETRAKKLACACGGEGEDLPGDHDVGCPWGLDVDIDPMGEPYRAGFGLLWNEINGKRAPWIENPWVRAVDFKLVRT